MPIGADGLSGTVSTSGAGLRGGSLHSGEEEKPLPHGFVRLKSGGIGVDINIAREVGRKAMAASPELTRKARAYEADVLQFSGSGGIQMQGRAPWSRSGGSDVNVAEKSPPGWSGTVKAMKKHSDIDNPFALAWSMKKKGYKPHVKPEESILDVLSDAELVLEGSIPTADLAAKPPKGVDPEVWHDVVHRGKHTDYGGARAHYNRTIAKMKNATPGPAPEPSAAELSGGRYGTERYRELNQKPFVAPGWHRNVGEANDDADQFYTDRIPNFPKKRRFSSVDADHLRAQRTGDWQNRNVGHKYRADTDADLQFQHHDWNLLGRRGHTLHYSHPAGHTAWTRPDGSWEVSDKKGHNYSHERHDLGFVLGNLGESLVREYGDDDFGSMSPDTIGSRLEQAGWHFHGNREDTSTYSHPNHGKVTLNDYGWTHTHDKGKKSGSTTRGFFNYWKTYAASKKQKTESESYLTGSPTDKTRLTGQIQIRIREGTTIDVRSPDRILDNMNAYIFFEQWQQYLPKSPLLQANTMFRISEWWKLHAERGDVLSINLTNGLTSVVNESTGKQYSLGCFGTQPDLFLDGMESLEKL